MSIVSLAEVKTYLGLTGTQDDQVISSLIPVAEARLERDTGRTFSYTSNTSHTYSTDGQASLNIRDAPSNGSNTRTVTLGGVTLTEGTGYWLLPDRRNPDVSTTVQLQFYDTSRAGWYKADPQWWDKNLDTFYARGATPNDLVISGSEGHPYPVPADIVGMAKVMTALLYWQAKSGASGTVQTPTGETIDLSQDPIGYDQFVRDWRVRTAVSGV